MQEENRREALKIIGAIGGTCAFPFASNELYGQQEAPVTAPQHVHPRVGPPQRPATVGGPVKPGYFSEHEFAVVSRLADLIIPKTDTAGALDAGVPAYIDAVVGASKPLQEVCRAGFALPETKTFVEKSEADQIAILTIWSEANPASKPARFFQLVKNLTADGYYTSYEGLIEELGYRGNQALTHFPEARLEEH